MQKRGAHWYGDGQDDIRKELARYRRLAGYPAERFVDARCANSEDVRWLYVGARCPDCGLTACHGDWKNEFHGVDALFAGELGH